MCIYVFLVINERYLETYHKKFDTKIYMRLKEDDILINGNNITLGFRPRFSLVEILTKEDISCQLVYSKFFGFLLTILLRSTF